MSEKMKSIGTFVLEKQRGKHWTLWQRKQYKCLNIGFTIELLTSWMETIHTTNDIESSAYILILQMKTSAKKTWVME